MNRKLITLTITLSLLFFLPSFNILNAQASFDLGITQMTKLNEEYTQVPLHLDPDLPLEVEVKNLGTNSVSNVSMTITVYDPWMNPTYTVSATPIPTLASSSTATMYAGTYQPHGPGVYTVEYVASITEADMVTANDTTTQIFEVSTYTYARDNGPIAGSLGIGANNGGYIGQSFDLPAPANLTSVDVYISSPIVGEPLAVDIMGMGATPSGILGTTDTLIFTSTTPGWFNLPVSGSSLSLAMGTFVLNVIEFDSTQSVGYTFDIHTSSKTWLWWPTNPFGPWSNGEDFGYNVALMIRANLDPACGAIGGGLSSTSIDCPGDSNATSLVLPTGGYAPYTFLWNNGQTGIIATSLNAGAYSCTVTDMYGCSGSSNIEILMDPPVLNVASNIEDVRCFGDDNGTAMAIPSGGTPPFTYLWSTGQTSQMATSFSPGSYSVTVTDINGCETSQNVLIIEPSTPLGAAIFNNPPTCASCNDGDAAASVTGGTPPYSYTWSNGGFTATTTGLGSGTYYVTITDANGCMFTDSTQILLGDGIFPIPVSTATIYPNPSSGRFNVKLTLETNAIVEMEVLNMNGQRVWSEVKMGHNFLETVVDISDLSKGFYMFRAHFNGQSVSKKLILK